MLRILQRLHRTPAIAEPQQLDPGLIYDCELAGLEIPYELLDAWVTELGRDLKPGEAAAALYAWQAALRFRVLSPQAKQIVGNCLRPLPKATPTILALEEVLHLMLFRSGSIRANLESLSYLRIAGSDLLDIPGSLSAQEHLDQIPTAAAATYWDDAVHISEMVEQGMTECEIEQGTRILALLETSAWSMATAELEGRGYIAAIGPEYRIVGNSDPGSADRLLIRVHESRLHFGPNDGESLFLSALPSRYSQIFVGDCSSQINLGADLMDAEVLPAEQERMPTDALGLVAGQQVEVGGFRVLFSEKAEAAWRCEHQLFDNSFEFPILIGSPQGLIGATIRSSSTDRDFSQLTIEQLSFVDCTKLRRDADTVEATLLGGLETLVQAAILSSYVDEFVC